MSSATSTDSAAEIEPRAAGDHDPADDPGLRPWQFFLLAGMLAATATVLVATGQSPASIVTLSLTIVAASFVGLGALRMFLPLVSKDLTTTPTLLAGRTRAALEREKTLALRALKELEFDRAMGKIAQSDFDEMSGRLRARAIGLMRQLDAGVGYREQIEQELRKRLGELGAGGRAAGGRDGGRDFSPAGSDRADAGSHVTQLSCADCQTLNDADAKFCKNCGARVTA